MEYEKVKNVYVSRDYDKFRLIEHNRAINNTHVTRISESMKNNFLINPIIVNENLEIIDGQHRFEACKKIKKPVYFIMNKNYGFKEVTILNENQKNWSLFDFHTHYVDCGKDEYVMLNDFLNHFQLSLNSALTLVFDNLNGSGNSNLRFVFKTGNFIFKNQKKAHDTASKYVAIRDLWDFSNFRSFIIAFKNISKNKNFEWKRFLHQAQTYPFVLEKRSTAHDYLRLFQKLYNHQRKHRKRLFDDL